MQVGWTDVSSLKSRALYPKAMGPVRIQDVAHPAEQGSGSVFAQQQSLGWASAMHDRTAIFVLGMHRSGTSALTRVFSFLGASLPRNLYPPGLGNETGHWEPEAAVQLNDRILSMARTSVNVLGNCLATAVVAGIVAIIVSKLFKPHGNDPS